MATTAKKTAPSKARRVIETKAILSPVQQPVEPDLGPLVLVTIAKDFTLTRDHGGVVNYKAGAQRMPKKDADHWWSKTQGGVKPLEE